LIERMEALASGECGDIEANHVKADEILCEALRRLGQDRLVELFEKVEKWYA